MVIDIVDYTEQQFAALRKASLQKIREAQVKKNELFKELNEKILEEKQRLIDRGVFPSNIWEKKKAELIAAYDEEVEALRETLLFYLYYEGGSSDVPDEVLYPVDYSLPVEERMSQVRAYYQTTYSDAAERFNAFAADAFARTYLGELYAPLYHYFEAQVAV